MTASNNAADNNNNASAGGGSLSDFRSSMLSKLGVTAAPKYERRGPNQHEMLDDTIRELNGEFRAKMARVLEDSGVFTRVTYPEGLNAREVAADVSFESRIASIKGFQSVRDFMIFYPRIQGDIEDIIKCNAMLDGLSPVIGRTNGLSKSMTLKDQTSINELVLDLHEAGFYGVHDSDDVMAFDEKNIPTFRAGISFTRKGNLGTQSMEVSVRWAANNELVEKFIRIVRNHVAVSGAIDAGVYDTIIGITGGKMDIKSESLQDSQEAVPAFYPWMNETDIAQYFLDFLNSSANVLILYGPPGTGKTTMIRTAVKRLGLRALGTADQTLMSMPGFVQICGTHMSGGGENGKYDVLVAEDSEILTKKRLNEEGQVVNPVMASLLNAVDGVSKETSFKLVITTNLPNLLDMDTALLRPGRCFDVMEFGRLTAEQGMTIRAMLGKENKRLASPNGYLLAEILNMDTTKSELIDGHAIVSPRFPLPKKK